MSEHCEESGLIRTNNVQLFVNKFFNLSDVSN